MITDLSKLSISLLTYQVPQVQACQSSDGTVNDDRVRLVAPCTYRIQIGSSIYDLTIYPPFAFEASIPWGLGWLLGHKCSMKNLVYALPHDALYTTHILSRVLADKLLDEIAERVGKSGLVSTLTYRGVKWFGRTAWNNGGNLSADKCREICTLVEVTAEITPLEMALALYPIDEDCEDGTG